MSGRKFNSVSKTRFFHTKTILNFTLVILWTASRQRFIVFIESLIHLKRALAGCVQRAQTTSAFSRPTPPSTTHQHPWPHAVACINTHFLLHGWQFLKLIVFKNSVSHPVAPRNRMSYARALQQQPSASARSYKCTYVHILLTFGSCPAKWMYGQTSAGKSSECRHSHGRAPAFIQLKRIYAPVNFTKGFLLGLQRAARTHFANTRRRLTHSHK